MFSVSMIRCLSFGDSMSQQSQQTRMEMVAMEQKIEIRIVVMKEAVKYFQRVLKRKWRLERQNRVQMKDIRMERRKRPQVWDLERNMRVSEKEREQHENSSKVTRRRCIAAMGQILFMRYQCYQYFNLNDYSIIDLSRNLYNNLNQIKQQTQIFVIYYHLHCIFTFLQYLNMSPSHYPQFHLPQSFYHLQLTIKKFDIIQKALKSIENIPELSKAGVLFNSILSELEVMKQSIENYVMTTEEELHKMQQQQEEEEQNNQQNQHHQTAPQEQLEQHNYILEFYDSKLKSQQTKINTLLSQNTHLKLQNQHNAKQLALLQSQLFTLKQQIELFQNHEKNKQFESIDMLMLEINKLIEELKYKDVRIEEMARELDRAREEGEMEWKANCIGNSERILEINKEMDVTRGEYMKLVSELEMEIEIVRKQNVELVTKMVVNEGKKTQLEETVLSKEKEIKELNVVLKKKEKDLEMYYEEQDRNSDKKLELIRSKQTQFKHLQLQLQKSQHQLSLLTQTLQSKTQQLALLQSQNIQLHNHLSTKQDELLANARLLQTLTTKYQSEKKTKEILESETEQMKYEMKQIVEKLDLAGKWKGELERERQQKGALWKEVNQKLGYYDVVFTEVKAESLRKEEEWKGYVGVVRKEYEEVIEELMRGKKGLDSIIQEMKEKMQVQNNKIQVQSEQINMEKKRNIELKIRIDEQSNHTQKHQELGSNYLILQQQNSRLKKLYRQSEEQLSHLLDSKNKIQQLQVRIQEMIGKEHKYEEKIVKMSEEYERKLKEIEGKLMKFNEIVAQKQLEVAELGTKNKGLIDDLFSCKRASALEKTRLETRLGELEKVLKDRKAFQAKVNNLIF